MNILKSQGLKVLLFGLAFCLLTFLNSYAQDNAILAKDFKYGYCPITGNQIIDANGRMLPNYRIVWFNLSNGAKMPLAVDADAVDVITEADFPRIMEWVRAGWMFEINGKQWSPQQVQEYKDKFFNLTIVSMDK